jgi:hypothetical protein
VEFRYMTKDTQFPVGDQESWTLVYPTGKKEQGLLDSNGRVRRDGVPAGNYQLQPKYLTGATWLKSFVFGGDKTTIQVRGENIPDGEAVQIQIFRQYQSMSGQPLDTLSASFQGGIAKADWSYQQQTGEPPYGNFVALAKWKSKSATSPPLKVQAYPADEDKGLQQRLKHLGYYAGAIDGVVGSQTESAVRKMQEDHPPLVVDGIAGPLTRGLLGDITY